MALSPTIIDRVLLATRQAMTLPHGQQRVPYQAAADELGVSYQTLMRWRNEVALVPGRKRRSDSGQISLARSEAEIISAFMQESHRRNGKRLASVELAVTALRANGLIKAEAVDAKTGEISLLSISTISRALRTYGLHPDMSISVQ